MSNRARFRRAGLVAGTWDYLTAYEEVLERAWGELDGKLPISESGRELFVKVERRVDNLLKESYFEPMSSYQQGLWIAADRLADPSASYHDEMFPKEVGDVLRLATKLMAQSKLLWDAKQFGFATGTTRWLWEAPKQKPGYHPDTEFPQSRHLKPPQ